jgi:hypothetical protein
LAYLDSWNKIGEPKVTVFSARRVVGSTTYKTHNDAKYAVEKLGIAIKEPRPKPNPEFAALMEEGVNTRPTPFQPEVISFFDTGAFGVSWTATSSQFIAPSLTFKQVEALLGPPERIDTQIVPSKRDILPTWLTMHVYAGGRVIFVETSMAPKPGFVARIILDVPAATAALFEGVR